MTNHYSDRDHERQRLQPGQLFRLTLNLEDSFGWYDFSIATAGDTSFLRRLSGHVETGAHSFSDPAIGGKSSRTSDDGHRENEDVQGG